LAAAGSIRRRHFSQAALHQRATISAPKSVSLAALVGDDESVREAHRESVQETLKEAEKYTQARGGGDNPAITTGKMVAAQFEHTSSRPDQKNGYAAPQLHTHVVIFNMTQTEDGKVRSVESGELFDSQKLATAIYRAHLADKLQELGYEIRVDPHTGAPEIKGFTAAYLQDSSPPPPRSFERRKKDKRTHGERRKNGFRQRQIETSCRSKKSPQQEFRPRLNAHTRPRNGRKARLPSSTRCS
jgi:conjugative relaxase-like TrwC/TraI family protein